MRHDKRSSRVVGSRQARPNLEALESRQLLAIFSVTNTGDLGAGSLRQAILDANAAIGADTIDFAITGAGVHTIAPQTQLPTVSEPVTIDGTSQTGFDGIPLIELSGANLGVGKVGLQITAGSSVVRGLIINRVKAQNNSSNSPFANGGFGIELSSGGGNLIETNIIGTDASGNAAIGNTFGIHILNSPNNTIGGVTAAVGNLISGNLSASQTEIPRNGAGIVIEGASSTRNIIARNAIGTDSSGATQVPNGSGVILSNAAENLIGGISATQRNFISGNASYGVWLLQNASGNLIQGNYFGVDPTGETPVGRSMVLNPSETLQKQMDIVLTDGASANTIGGSASSAGNVISAINVGIVLSGESVTNNVIQGNFIGTNASGTKAIGSGPFGSGAFPGGIGVELSAPGNTIGGTTGGTSNLLSGLLFGTETGRVLSNDGTLIAPVIPVNAAGSVIQGNLIGTDLTGVLPVPNNYGVYVVRDASGLLVGGTVAGAGNVIAYNQGYATYVNGGRLLTVLGNSIFSNNTTNPGVSDIGVNPGSNDNVKPPTLLSLSAASPSGSQVLMGRVTGTPGTTGTIEIFTSPPRNPNIPSTAPGQGKTLASRLSGVLLDVDGNFSFLQTLTPPPGEPYFSATFTDSLGNTSEFSNPLPVPPTKADLAILGYNASGTVGDPVSYQFSVDNLGPDPSTGTVLTHTLPTGWTFVSVVVSTGTVSQTGGVITANFGTMSVGQRAAIAIVAIPSQAGAIPVTATVTSQDPDPTSGNNTATATITVAPLTARLAVSQTVTPNPVPAGGALTYTIFVANTGAAPASGVTVRDTLPTGVVLLSATTSQGQVSAAAGTVSANLGTIAPGATATLVIVVRPTTPGSLTNRVDVASTDPVLNVTNSQTSTVVSPVPRVIGVRRAGFHNRSTQILVTFNTPLNTFRAQVVNNYRLALLRNGQPAGNYKIKSASYNAGTQTVTLTTAGKIPLQKFVRLTVVGVPPGGLIDNNGQALDGAGTGTPGTNYVATLFGFGYVDSGKTSTSSVKLANR